MTMMKPETRLGKISRAATIAALLAAPAEGLRQYAYYDPVGILTVCYGDTSNVEKGKKYSIEECKARLETDMLDSIKAVEQCVPNLPEGVLAAFGDAVYNIGPTVACDRSKSTAARLLIARDYEGACNQLPKWNKATLAGVKITLPGLTKRRNAERDLCLSSL